MSVDAHHALASSNDDLKTVLNNMMMRGGEGGGTGLACALTNSDLRRDADA